MPVHTPRHAHRVNDTLNKAKRPRATKKALSRTAPIRGKGLLSEDQLTTTTPKRRK